MGEGDSKKMQKLVLNRAKTNQTRDWPYQVNSWTFVMVVAALLYYKKFVKRLTKRGYKINPFDGCVANKTVKEKQIMICFHVDDCKISHESSKVINETIEWLREEYQSIFKDGSGAMKVHRGKVHKYLGMTLDFSHKGKCRVSMYYYVDGILEAFDDDIKKYDDGYLNLHVL